MSFQSVVAFIKEIIKMMIMLLMMFMRVITIGIIHR